MYIRVARPSDFGLKDAVAELALSAGAALHPARQCVVVDVSDKGEAELVLPIVFKCRKDAEEYARKRAKDEPGLTFSVFEIVSRSRVPSAQAVTTPA